MTNTTKRYEKQARVMTEAWKEYKSYGNWESSFTYVHSFRQCLKDAWELENIILDNSDSLKSNNVASIFNILTSMERSVEYNSTEFFSFNAELILKTVSEKSTGFQSDISRRALLNNRLSTKQAWCVAYEFKNVA